MKTTPDRAARIRRRADRTANPIAADRLRRLADEADTIVDVSLRRRAI